MSVTDFVSGEIKVVFKEIIKRKKKKITIYFIAFGGLLLLAFSLRIYIRSQYNNAVTMLENGMYQDAIDIFRGLGTYQFSKEYISLAEQAILYDESMYFYNNSEYERALQGFLSLSDYKDSKEMAIDSKYKYAIKLYQDEDYEKAVPLFIELGDYNESEIYLARSILPSIDSVQQEVYDTAIKYYNDKNYREALFEFESLQGYRDSIEMTEECREALMRKLATTISAGIWYTIGLQEDGTVLSTGYNGDGQSDFAGWRDIISVNGQGILSIGLKADGTVITAGKLNGKYLDTNSWEDIVQVAAGERYVVGLKKDGTLVGVGHDAGDGQLMFTEWNNIVCIATGWRHTVGLDSEGNIYITGYRSSQQLRQIKENKEAWTHIIAITAGGGNEKGKGHTVALKDDGTVVAVGDNEYGQCNVETWTDIVAIAAGDWHTVGLKSDGTVVATGWDGTDNFYKTENACSVEDWKDIVAIAAGTGYTIGLKSNGTIVAVGYNEQNKQVGALEWKDIKIYEEWNR